LNKKVGKRPASIGRDAANLNARGSLGTELGLCKQTRVRYNEIFAWLVVLSFFTQVLPSGLTGIRIKIATSSTSNGRRFACRAINVATSKRVLSRSLFFFSSLSGNSQERDFVFFFVGAITTMGLSTRTNRAAAGSPFVIKKKKSPVASASGFAARIRPTP